MNDLLRQKKSSPGIVAKQFLTFRIGHEKYCMELSQTREII